MDQDVKQYLEALENRIKSLDLRVTGARNHQNSLEERIANIERRLFDLETKGTA